MNLIGVDVSLTGWSSIHKYLSEDGCQLFYSLGNHDFDFGVIIHAFHILEQLKITSLLRISSSLTSSAGNYFREPHKLYDSWGGSQ